MQNSDDPKWLKKNLDFEITDDAEAAELMEAFLETDDFSKAEKSADLAPSPPESHTAAKRSKSKSTRSIDLHGLTVKEAQAKIIKSIQADPRGAAITDFEIITGKGRHSGPGGGVLIKEIYHFILSNYSNSLLKIDSDPSQDLINGLPLKGAFHVSIRTKS